MEKSYISKYGKLIKKSPGLHEFWHKGTLVAKGSSLSSPNPLASPTKNDWQYCKDLLKNKEA
jgi:hypothetical protein